MIIYCNQALFFFIIELYFVSGNEDHYKQIHINVNLMLARVFLKYNS